jgi:hypothetical protein
VFLWKAPLGRDELRNGSNQYLVAWLGWNFLVAVAVLLLLYFHPSYLQ